MQVGVSKRTLRQLKEDALIGALEPRRRLGSKAYERQTVQGDRADGFFHWLYWHMEEPLADTNVEKRHVWDPLADEGNPHTDEILPHVPQGNFDMGLEELHNLPKKTSGPGKDGGAVRAIHVMFGWRLCFEKHFSSNLPTKVAGSLGIPRYRTARQVHDLHQNIQDEGFGTDCRLEGSTQERP